MGFSTTPPLRDKFDRPDANNRKVDLAIFFDSLSLHV